MTRPDRPVTLVGHGHHDDAIAVYDDVIDRFGTATELFLREQAVNALFDKVRTLDGLGRTDKTITVYDDIAARFGAATELSLREI